MIENNTLLFQRDDESDFEYHKRLIYGKLEDKTLADYDYSELSKYVYGKEFSTDVARRLMYGSKRTLDLISDLDVKSSPDNPSSEVESEFLSSIDRRMMDLRKEQQKFYDQRRELNKMLMREAREEHLEDIIKSTMASMDLTDMYDEVGFIQNTDECEAVLVLSDWHYGMKTDNIFNRYNTDICRCRVQDVVKKAIQRITLHKCGKLHIILLGDFVHGALRASTRVASEELVVDQLMNVSEILAQSINELSQFVNFVYVYSTYGNHARVVPDKKDSIHADNYERIIGWWLEQRFINNEKIEIIYDERWEFIIAKVCGHDLCAVHGDIDNVKSSPKLLTTLFHKEFGIDIEYIILGDKHHRESFEELGVTSMICGSLCGADDYANDKRLYSSPGQLLMIFNYDGLDAEYRLRTE